MKYNISILKKDFNYIILEYQIISTFYKNIVSQYVG